MAVCSFLGSEVYDLDFNQKLRKAIAKIIRENDKVEFLFSRRESFGYLCLATVMETKLQWPQKDITIVQTAKSESVDAFKEQIRKTDTFILPCITDKIALLPPSSKREIRIVVDHKEERWAIEHSTHLISYHYPVLSGSEQMLYNLAKKKKLKIMDITNKETVRNISTLTQQLSEKEQQILEMNAKGLTNKQIGGQLGISASGAQRAVVSACRKVRTKLRNHYFEQLHESIYEPITCSIFMLGQATYKSMLEFKQAVLFLIRHYHVNQFYVEEICCSSPYMNMLKEAVIGSGSKIIGITHYPDMPQGVWQQTVAQLCPPCDEVENMDPHTRSIRAKKLRTAKAMLERSDFCICRLQDHPLEKSIRGYMKRLHGLKTLDISRGCDDIIFEEVKPEGSRHTAPRPL